MSTTNGIYVQKYRKLHQMFLLHLKYAWDADTDDHLLLVQNPRLLGRYPAAEALKLAGDLGTTDESASPVPIVVFDESCLITLGI